MASMKTHAHYTVINVNVVRGHLYFFFKLSYKSQGFMQDFSLEGEEVLCAKCAKNGYLLYPPNMHFSAEISVICF